MLSQLSYHGLSEIAIFEGTSSYGTHFSECNEKVRGLTKIWTQIAWFKKKIFIWSSNLTVFACTYYLFYNFSDHTIIMVDYMWENSVALSFSKLLLGLALPAFSPSESLPVLETPTIVLLYLCWGRIFPINTYFLGFSARRFLLSVILRSQPALYTVWTHELWLRH